MAAENNTEVGQPNSAEPRPKLAFLGPIGTYSHQTAYERFGDSVDYVARRTIADTFRTVDEAFPLALLPQENSIFGSVIETYDLLRDSSLGRTVWIRDAVVLPVQHSLVTRSGVKLSDVRRVLSHEQALGQCVRFLDTHLPGVKKESVPSTAGAAERLSKDESMSDAAAICSKFCTKLFPGLEVLHEGIQNESHNFTRFYVLSNSQTTSLPGSAAPNGQHHALFRLSLPSSSTDRATEVVTALGKRIVPDITTLLLALDLPVERIDRRPSLVLGDKQFNDVYIAEVASKPSDTNQEQLARGWSEELQAAILRIGKAGGNGELIGYW